MNRKPYSFTTALDLMVGFLATNSPVGGLFVLAEANERSNKQANYDLLLVLITVSAAKAEFEELSYKSNITLSCCTRHHHSVIF